jgi:hypothetical protein
VEDAEIAHIYFRLSFLFAFRSDIDVEFVEGCFFPIPLFPGDNTDGAVGEPYAVADQSGDTNAPDVSKTEEPVIIDVGDNDSDFIGVGVCPRLVPPQRLSFII